MNLKRLGILYFIIFSFFACNSKMGHDLRQINTDSSTIKDVSHDSYLKLHFHNGNVAGITQWETTVQDSVLGKGTLYNPNRKIIQKGKLQFSLDDIAIVETNDLTALKTSDNSRLIGMTILLVGNVLIDFYCVVNPKACFGSCPTFYAPGKDKLLDSNAEGFSKSITPYLEEGDIDALKFSTKQKSFQLTMKNEALETHCINEVKLYAVPRMDSELIFHNPDGIFYRCENNIPCKSAMSMTDVTEKVLQIDESEYFSASDSNNLLKQEELIVEFDAPKDKNLGLVINFRQTLMSTFLFYNTLSLMGDEVGTQFANLESKKFYQRRFEKAFNPLRHIKIYQWENKIWKLVGKISEQGPIAKNLQMLPIESTENEEVKLKLVMAQGNWRIDYLGLTEIKSEVKPHILTPKSIKGKQINDEKLKSITKDDDEYLYTFSGDQYLLDFELPAIKKDQTNELFVYSKGYYLEWMRKEWLWEKDITKFTKMMLMNKKTWRSLAREFKAVEGDMENTFWNSKVSTEE